MMSLEIIILAAGDGKRMKSDLPKVLHPIGGKPMLARVIETAMQLAPKKIHIVCGVHSEKIQKDLAPFITFPLHWVYQEKPLGTGHAVQTALPFLNSASQVLVLFGDVPLISAQTLQNLQKATLNHALGLLCVNMPNPFGFGRVLRDNDQKIIGIIEEKDANDTQKKITEIFPGILLSTVEALTRWLKQLRCDNAQGEYYLTDIVAMAAAEGLSVPSVHTANISEVQGINDRWQLATLERIYQENLAKIWLLEGIQIMDPKRIDIRGEFTCGQDTVIDVNVVFKGNNSLGKNCYIGPNCLIKNCVIQDNVIIQANSILDGAEIAAHCEIGPYARLRPGTVLEEYVKVGNFVEVKKTHIGANSKANHLSYLGDAIIGKRVNIGAGTITCNYDGVNKFQTIIEDGAFIGSDTQLIAPVRIGKNATIGAGATIRKDAPAEQLTLSDVRQKSLPGWKRPVRKN